MSSFHFNLFSWKPHYGRPWKKHIHSLVTWWCWCGLIYLSTKHAILQKLVSNFFFTARLKVPKAVSQGHQSSILIALSWNIYTKKRTPAIGRFGIFCVAHQRTINNLMEGWLNHNGNGNFNAWTCGWLVCVCVCDGGMRLMPFRPFSERWYARRRSDIYFNSVLITL
jgi:hypothetical protein